MDAHVLFEETDVEQLITWYSMTVVSPTREKEQVTRECLTGGSGLLWGSGNSSVNSCKGWVELWARQDTS